MREEFKYNLNDISKMQHTTFNDIEGYSKIIQSSSSWSNAVVSTANYDFKDRVKKELVEKIVEELIEEDLVVFTEGPNFNTFELSTEYRARLRLWDELGFRKKFTSCEFI